jgi:septum formation inhibitor MinC
VKEAQMTKERLQDAEEMINNRRMYELVQQEGPKVRSIAEERALIKNLNHQSQSLYTIESAYKQTLAQAVPKGPVQLPSGSWTEEVKLPS